MVENVWSFAIVAWSSGIFACYGIPTYFMNDYMHIYVAMYHYTFRFISLRAPCCVFFNVVLFSVHGSVKSDDYPGFVVGLGIYPNVTFGI